MPYAVDNRAFQLRSDQAQAGRGALQAELALDPSRPVILFASKLQQRKQCADLIAAYTRLCAQASLDRVPYLVIVGDGEQRGTLEHQAQSSGIAANVRFCGFKNQSELPRFFDLATVFVLPSRHEPWGLIVNEVMNAARAVIVSDDVGCQPDLITDGVEGIVFPVGDVAALAQAIERALASPETAVQMGLRARERIAAWSFEEDVQGLRRALTLATGRPLS
jgi:glycosyltransferase involved in cell wall biosynthesis